MTTNNLYHYIKTGAFLHELHDAPDAIVWEEIPSGEHIPQTKTLHTSYAALGYDFSNGGKIAAYLQDKRYCILILDTIGLISCSDMLTFVANHPHCIIINLGVGVTGIQNKHSLETNDYAQIASRMPIMEPLDSVHFHILLQQGKTGYIRIANDELPDALFDEEHKALYDHADISMTSFGYTGIGGTIITSPHLLPTVSQALQFIKTTHGIGYDLFVHTNSREIYSDELKASLQLTGKLIRIHDQSTNDSIAQQEKASLQASQTHGDISIMMKHPVYETLTSLLPEYMYEQVGFDSEILANYLLSLG